MSRNRSNVKYPPIPLSENDDYIVTRKGDSLDKLALTYYNNSSLYWIIQRANPTLQSDTIYPPPGTQLRIPLNYTVILSNFNSIS